MATDMMEQSDKLALRFKTIGNLWNVPVPLDAKGYDWIAIEVPPETPEWEAILDRLRRAKWRP